MRVARIIERISPRRLLLRHVLALNAIYAGASIIALVWRETFHEWLGITSQHHLPARVLMLTVLMMAYNYLFFTKRSLGLVSAVFIVYTLFFGAHDLLLTAEVGGAMKPHIVQSIVRLLAVWLVIRVWMDDYFANWLKANSEEADLQLSSTAP